MLPSVEQRAVGWPRGAARFHPRFSPSQEEELFPFNLDEFVTVDEVLEEGESPSAQTQRAQPRGKRKECSRCGSEPGSKRRKERSPPQRPDSQLAFLMLDEIGEEEEEEEEAAGARLGMLVVDEVLDEEEPTARGGKEPRAPLASERDGGASRGRTAKPEPLVTVDEIGEVEELPLNEPGELSAEEGPKRREEDEEEEEEEEEKGGAEEPCPVPDDPSALVTVDEIRDDNDDDEDFLADFNRLKEELNFVTVDEVGEEDEEEEEEGAVPGGNPKEGTDGEETAAVGPEGDVGEDTDAVAGPEEMQILRGQRPEEEGNAASSAK
ncbi:hypothetical protein CIB84_016052, partial [Bambusicola thoracicus]